MFGLLGSFPRPRLYNVLIRNTPGPDDYEFTWSYVGDPTGYGILFEGYDLTNQLAAQFNFPLTTPSPLTGDVTAWLYYNPVLGLNGYYIIIKVREISTGNVYDAGFRFDPPFPL